MFLPKIPDHIPISKTVSLAMAAPDIARASMDAEKAQAMEIERASSKSGDDIVVDDKEVKRIRHRVDWRLIPALGAMYGLG